MCGCVKHIVKVGMARENAPPSKDDVVDITHITQDSESTNESVRFRIQAMMAERQADCAVVTMEHWNANNDCALMVLDCLYTEAFMQRKRAEEEKQRQEAIKKQTQLPIISPWSYL